MITLKLQVMANDKNKEIPIKHGEILVEAVDRALKNVPLPARAEDVFQVFVNGYYIEPKLWPFTRIVETDKVLIAPLIQGDDPGSVARAVLTIGAILVAPAIGGFLGATGGGLLAFNTAFTIGAAILVNQLIPPSQPELRGFEVDQPVSASQAYNINGQSNQARKLLTVPKVYGSHRMFPVVAAQPYTDVEADPSGKLSQYLYAIYDFGLGPCRVRDLKIGETPINNYTEVSYRFVDPNKPLPAPARSAEVIAWEDGNEPFGLYSTFNLYKGANQLDTISYTLTGNSVGEFNGANQKIANPTDYSTYEVIRNCPPNVDGVQQEIQVQFVCPSGLYAFDTQGNIGSRTIDLRIDFSKADEDFWRPYNDVGAVSSFYAVGGEQGTRPIESTTPALNESVTPQAAQTTFPYFPASNIIDSVLATDAGYSLLRTDINQAGMFSTPKYYPVYRPAESSTVSPWPHEDRQAYIVRDAELRIYGLPQGQTFVYAKPTETVEIGSYVSVFGQIVGKVASIANHPNGTLNSQGYRRYNLDTPLPRNYEISSYYYVNNSINVNYSNFFVPNSNTGVHSVISFTAPLIGYAKVTAASTQPVYATFKFTPIEIGDYKVRVTRQSTQSVNQFQKEDTLVFSTLQSRFNTSAIVTDKRHTFLEIRIKATNQLNGTIQDLSGIVDSIVESYDPDAETWQYQFNTNPAWVYTDLLIGEVNKRALTKSRLDLPSLVAWAEFCDEIPTAPINYEAFNRVRFEANFILDYDTNLQGVLNQVSAIGQASPNVVDGKYGILVDKNQTVPVQIFTPRNSWGFSSSRNYVETPHAVRVKWVNPDKNWEVDETIVYDTGYTEANATEIQDLQAFGVTNVEQAWRYGRFNMAVHRLRQETITIQVDFEHLVCTRGDYVQLTQDVMKVGGTPARVKTVSGNQITIDEGLETGPGSYGYVYRGSDGVIHQDTLTVVDSITFDLDGDIPDVGDLIVIGLVSNIVLDCVVKSITPNDDLSATITLLEKAPAIYDAESTDDFPVYDPQISPIADAIFAPPGEVQNLVVDSNTVVCNASNTGYNYLIELDWDPPGNSAVEIYQIYADVGLGFDLVGQTRASSYTYSVDQDDLDAEHFFKVLAVSANGNKLELAAIPTVSATPVTDTVRPDNVESLAIDITDQVLTLFWPPVLNCDLAEYFVRYSPNTGATWESSTPLLRVDKSNTNATTQARTGVYFIKAVDYAGNESDTAASAITTIPELFGLNVIDDLNDFPALAGVVDRTENLGGSLLLQRTVIGGPGIDEYEPEGYYYYQDLLDIGDIYTVRLQSLVEAEGYTAGDLMANWTSLDTVLQLNNSQFSEWDVETEYRTTNQFNVISNWTTMADIDYINEGSTDIFSPWRKFTITDATGRIFQFRLRLVSRRAAVSPRVYDGTIRADMPDRLESFNNLVAGPSGLTVNYTPPFKGPGTTPNIQISLDDAESGDYWAFTSRTLNSFTIVFYDSSNNPVTRTFDAQVKGYGRKYTDII